MTGSRAYLWLIGLVGLFMLLASVPAMLWLDHVPVAFYVLAGAGAVMVLFWLFYRWQAIRAAGTDPSLERSSRAAFAVTLAFAVTIVLNVLGHRYDARWDLTQSKRYSLSEQSVDVVSKLDREVKVLAFFPPGQREVEFRELIRRYTERTTLITVQVVDPYASPALVDQYKIVAESVILSSEESTQRLETAFDEESLTNALIRLSSSKEYAVCFVSGHGERALEDDASPTELGLLKGKLEGVNYTTQEIALLSSPPTPGTCPVVVLASPRDELLPIERDRLAQYVAAGGALFASLDPAMVPATAKDFARYGITVGADMALERDPYLQHPAMGPMGPLLDPSNYASHPITSKLRGATFFPVARSVGKGEEISGLAVQPLLFTSEQGVAVPPEWMIEAASSQTPPVRDPSAAVEGRLSLAVAVEISDPAGLRTKTEEALPVASVEGAASAAAVAPAAAPPTKAGGKLVVFGDGDFFSNGFILEGMNQDLVLNAIAWMVGEEDQISIRPNEEGEGLLLLDLVTLLTSGVLVLIVAPGLAVIAAVGVYLRRRKM